MKISYLWLVHISCCSCLLFIIIISHNKAQEKSWHNLKKKIRNEVKRTILDWKANKSHKISAFCHINYFPNTVEPRYNKPLFKEVFSIMNSIPQSIWVLLSINLRLLLNIYELEDTYVDTPILIINKLSKIIWNVK